MRMVKVALVLVMLSACNVSENLEDGYQAGDVTTGMIENKGAYCSAPYRGVRAVGRFIISMLGGLTVPDVCRAFDVIIDEPTPENERVLPGP